MLSTSHVNKAATSVPEELSILTRLEAERVRMLAQLAGLRRGFQETVDTFVDSHHADDEHDQRDQRSRSSARS